ncbi:TIGR03936 family radical SAM-associated protein [Paraclostridium ghonii]|uniref:TIGR03936 family radical SAM-associated protein n=1 Tax=Paraclostridium ghonii TaxID=29358 RepID=UPI00202CA74F|nr:TIGR03936 family radical SAM-associated protein [Paeniclostridium ghonii]MCM0165260.1 TIGR03936 family radical SAM-associated protein [Paeniclostridium ghonii]
MSKIIRCKFKKENDMIYISHLDLQRLLQRAFRRAEIQLSYSQGFNPHPKMSYGHALALGTESQGEYLDVEIEEDLTADEFLTKINATMPNGIEFIKAMEITKEVPSLASTIEYGEYMFTIEVDKELSKAFIKTKVLEIMNTEEIMISKKNKKGKTVEVNIRPMIKNFDVIDIEDKIITLEATVATGSKANLNTNIFIPKILEVFGLDIDPLDVDILRRELYVVKDGELVTPM